MSNTASSRSVRLLGLALVLSTPASGQTVQDMIAPDYIELKDSTRVDVTIHAVKNLERAPKKWEKAIIYSDVTAPDKLDTAFVKDLKRYQEFELWKAKWPTNEKGYVQFEEVIQVPGATASELFLMAKTWFVDYYKSANNVVQMEDKENGKIMGKGSSSFVAIGDKVLGIETYSGITLQYTVTIQVRDGRYRYTIDGINRRTDATQYGPAMDIPVDPNEPESNFTYKGKENKLAISMKEKTIREIGITAEAIKKGMTLENMQKEKDW